MTLQTTLNKSNEISCATFGLQNVENDSILSYCVFEKLKFLSHCRLQIFQKYLNNFQDVCG